MNASDSCSPLFAGAAALLEKRFAQATSLVSSGNYQQALDIFQELLAACPHEYTLQNNCAWLFEKLGRYAEAETAYRGLFEEMPGYANGALGYARMLEQGKRYVAAVTALRRSVAADPVNPGLLSGLGNALVMAGEAEAALLWYGLSVELDRHARATVSNLLYTLLMVRTIAPQVVARELDMCAAVPGLAVRISRVAKQLHSLSGEFIAGMHRRFEETCRIETAPAPPLSPGTRKRIRIGYLSADLYAHPVGYFLEGVIPAHDRNRFEIVVFSPYTERDELTAALKRSAEHWVVLHGTDRLEIVRQIRAWQLDIAVDMAGHTGGNYLDLFARRLAPLQITWGGYPGSTGLEAMDHILADQVALPPEDRPYYTERPLYLPHGYVSFRPPADAPLVGSLPALTTGCITFGSFNTVQKLNSSTLALWGAVLRALPGSRLFLKSKGFDDPLVRSAYWEKLAAEGVSSDRILLEGYAPRRELLAAYHQVDIALDPVPYQGGVTVLEALWMGVPTLVLRGKRPPFVRHAESHLTQAGVADWIVASEDAYVATALAWGSNLAGLSTLRSRLRQQMAASPICDTVAFTRDLEAAFTQVWSERSRH
ncbi:O-linked N-acetylglucosamine transferase, SPINDLY family protein [Trichlorobacter lovleyi]|uniref:protein O-GlcNAc transferase n=1 Tax=Trichlorobacter lovleyi (strain ATCC BAA-1151 / DSM 17278 / SZ) TaxID=398767 RepID=B3EBN5_TRIL1|nr:tetratricopeptide repeat protein [Trichlorobacter lovleyi]ACD97074.1 Tetratricopeptide domain protein [Trichlorobacter lovleyi SZ]